MKLHELIRTDIVLTIEAWKGFNVNSHWWNRWLWI